MTYSAVLDANVLVPSRVRDVLLSLAHGGLYRPLWSESILVEMLRHLPGALPEEQRGRLVEVMSGAFPEALVTCPPGLTCAAEAAINPKDRPVLRAAIVAAADVIVTEDTAFRAEGERARRLLHLELDFQGCAEFVAFAVDVDPTIAVDALEGMLARWDARTPGATLPRLLAWMDNQGWAEAAHLLNERRRHETRA